MLCAGHAELRQPGGVPSNQPPRFFLNALKGKIDPEWVGGAYEASSSHWSTTSLRLFEDCGLEDEDFEGLTKHFVDVRLDHQTVGITSVMDRTILCTDETNQI